MRLSKEAIEAASAIFDSRTENKAWKLSVGSRLRNDADIIHEIVVAPLVKRIAELEERIYMLERANAAFVYEYKNTRNTALCELEHWISEQTISGAFSPFCTKLYEKIRSLKEE